MNHVYIALLILAFLLIELLIGGTRLLFSLPSCGIIALVSFLSLHSFLKLRAKEARWRENIEPSANLKCLMATGAFSLYVVARIAFSPVDYLAREDLYILLGALMFYLFMALILTTPKYRLSFVMTLLVIALVHVTIGGVQYLRGESFPIFDFLQRTDPGLRAAGLYICPNHLAGYLEVSALMGLSIVCWSRQSFWLKLLAGYGALISGAGILLTGSRGGYLSTAFGLVVFLVLSWRALRRASRKGLWASAMGAIVVSAILFTGILALFSRHYALSSRASKLMDIQDVRMELWKPAVEQYKTSPIFGTGGGTYQYFARMFRSSHVVADPGFAHNDHLQFLAEYGLIGFLLAVGFAGCHLWFGAKALNYFVTDRPAARYRMQSDALALNIGALCCASVYLVHSLFDFNLHIPANAMLLGFVYGMLGNPGVVMPETTELDKKVSHYARLVLPAVGLWITAVGLPTLPAEYFAERARMALTEERYENAVSLAELGLAGDPKNPYLPLYLAQAHAGIAENAGATNAELARTSFQKAVEQFHSGLKLYPQEEWLLVGLGSALDGLEQFEEATKVYQEATRLNPTSAQVYNYYATHLRVAGQLDEAEKMYNKSMSLFPSTAAVTGLELLGEARRARATPPAQDKPR